LDLVEKIIEECDLREESPQNKIDDNLIRVAVLGRPNVGKSTLVNTILGENRLITSDIPGTTRDSIDIHLKRDGQEYVIVDTAGLRKKARVSSATIERYCMLRSLRALAQCDVAIVIVDAEQGAPVEQDAKIASLVHERGIPLLFVVNKWDAVEKDHRSAKKYTEDLYDVFRFAKYAPVIFISALTGRRCPSVLAKAKQLYESAKFRIQTADLNKLLERCFARKAPPAYRGNLIRFYFATQIDVSPPVIVLFVNYPRKVPASYQRFLVNQIRKAYPFEGSNIKLLLKKKKTREEQMTAVG